MRECCRWRRKIKLDQSNPTPSLPCAPGPMRHTNHCVLGKRVLSTDNCVCVCVCAYIRTVAKEEIKQPPLRITVNCKVKHRRRRRRCRRRYLSSFRMGERGSFHFKLSMPVGPTEGFWNHPQMDDVHLMGGGGAGGSNQQAER